MKSSLSRYKHYNVDMAASDEDQIRSKALQLRDICAKRTRTTSVRSWPQFDVDADEVYENIIVGDM